MYGSAHLLSIQDTFSTKPLDERLESRLSSDLKAWLQQLYPVVQKGIQDAHTQIREGVQDIRNFFFAGICCCWDDEAEKYGLRKA
jgi:hypothetical protein